MRKQTFSAKFGSLSFALLASTMPISGTVMAQDATTEGETSQKPALSATKTLELDPITITGEKISRSLENTAVSVAPVTQAEISRNLDGSDVADAIDSTPNVLYTGSADGAPVIRGQEAQGANTGAVAYFGGTVPRATINMDGHNQNYYEFLFGSAPLWDVESIEVFRGPQTTSQGANSIAGAIIVKTKDPTFTPEAALQAEIGNYNSKRASAMYSGPITDDLAFRVALDHSGRDTFIDYTNNSFSNGDIDLNFKSQNARMKLLWTPEAVPGLEALYSYSYTKARKPSLEAANTPYDELENTTTSMPNFRQDSNTHVLDVSYDINENVTLFNQTQYSDLYTRRQTFPYNRGSATLAEESFSNETRVNFGQEQDTFSGMAGYYYSHIDSEQYLNLMGKTEYDDTKKNLGIFTDLNYRLDDKWTLNGGLRFEHDTVTRTGVSNYSTEALDYDESFTVVLPKLSLSYKVDPNLTVGGLINRGYNPGGVSLNFTGARTYQTFDEETLWNYELFTRARLLNNKLHLNGNLFFMDMKDAQRYFQETVGGTTNVYVLNAERAQSYGLEVSADYQALDNLKLKAGAGILQTEIKEFSLRPQYEGNEFNKAPAYSLTLGIDYNITDDLLWSLDTRLTDGYESDTENTSSKWIKGYSLTNTRITYDLFENTQIYGYVNNVFDKRAPTVHHARYGAYMTEPRMFGAGLKVEF